VGRAVTLAAVMDFVVGVVFGVVALAAPSTMPLPDPAPAVVHQDCPGLATRSCYAATANTIYLAPGEGRFMLLHEEGHAVDAQRLDDAERASFTRLMELDGPWLGATTAESAGGDVDYAGEEFADMYALCQDRSRYAEARVCRFIRRAARR
jgi:hypothetical protein